MRWIFLSDLHFSRNNYQLLQQTCDWIVNELTQKVSYSFVTDIFILGNTIDNERSNVDVESQQLATLFFQRLLNLSTKPTLHVLIGERDLDTSLYTKKSETSSLSAFEGKERLVIYKQPTFINVIDQTQTKQFKPKKWPVLILPFVYDQRQVQLYIEQQLPQEIDRDRIVVVSHTTILNVTRDCNENLEHDTLTHIDLQHNPHHPLSLHYFLNFRRTFLGGSHRHRTIVSKQLKELSKVPLQTSSLGLVVSVGSPVQHHAREANDLHKGFVLYDPVENENELVINPLASRYISATYKQWKEILLDDTEHQSWVTVYLQNEQNNKSQQIALIELTLSEEHDQELITTINQIRRKFDFGNVTPTIVKALSYQQNIELDEVDEENNEVLVGGSSDEPLVSFTDKIKQYTKMFVQQSLGSNDPVVDSSLWSSRSSYDTSSDTESTDEIDVEVECVMDMSELENATDALIKPMIEVIQKIADEQIRDVEVASKRFVIQKLEITNFMSIRQRIIADWDQLEPGVWWVEGANGSGKSLLMEVVVWVLYGELERSNTNVEDVCWRPGKEQIYNTPEKRQPTIVQLTIQNTQDNKVWIIERKRTWKRSDRSTMSLRFYEQDVLRAANQDQSSLVETVLNGLTLSQFLQAHVVSSTGTQRFFNSTPIQRRLMIESLLGFDVLEKYNDHWKQQESIWKKNAEQLKQKRNELDLDKERHQGQINLINVKKQAKIDALKALEKRRLELQSTFDRSLKKYKEDLKLYTTHLSKLERLAKRLGPSSLRTTQDSIELCEKQIAGKQSEMQQWANFNEWLREHERLEQKLASLEQGTNMQHKEHLIASSVVQMETQMLPALYAELNRTNNVWAIEQCEAIQRLMTTNIRIPLTHLISRCENRQKDIYLAKQSIERSLVNKPVIKLSLLAETNETIQKEQALAHQNKNSLAQQIARLNASIQRLTHRKNLLIEYHTLVGSTPLLPVVPVQDLSLSTQISDDFYDSDNEEMVSTEDRLRVEKIQRELRMRERNLERQEMDHCRNRAVLDFWSQACATHTSHSKKGAFRSFMIQAELLELNQLLRRLRNELDIKEASIIVPNFIVSLESTQRQSQSMFCSSLSGFGLLQLDPETMRLTEITNAPKGSECSRSITMGSRSAGQRRRIDLILYMTLHKMFRQRSKCIFEWLFLDESLDYLDQKGQRSLQRWLIESCGKQERIMIVSQHDPAWNHGLKGVIYADRKLEEGTCYGMQRFNEHQRITSLIQRSNSSELNTLHDQHTIFTHFGWNPDSTNAVNQTKQIQRADQRNKRKIRV